MDITLYTTRGCSSCIAAKQLCNRAKVEFTAIEPGAPGEISKSEFQTQFPDVRGFPYVIIKQEGEEDIQFIGVVELSKLFLNKGLVSAEKK